MGHRINGCGNAAVAAAAAAAATVAMIAMIDHTGNVQDRSCTKAHSRTLAYASARTYAVNIVTGTTCAPSTNTR